MKTKVFSLLVALFATSTLWAYDFKYGDLYYNVTSNSDKTVAVTCSIDDFWEGVNYEGLTSADIPSSVTYNGTTYSVTSVGNSAFSRCPNLTSIKIPSSVTRIGDAAFWKSTNLTSIKIPNSVTSIGDGAFDETPWYEGKLDGVIYINKLLYGYKGEMPDNTSIVVKDGTIGIGSSAFADCRSLTSITIPNSVTNIGDRAFASCTSLTSITIPNGVTSIASYVFVNCSGLISINIPNSVTSIEERAFSDCESLTSITIPNSITSIGSRAFEYCTGLTAITIPNSVTSIEGDAFVGCTGLSSIVVSTGNPNYDSRNNCNAIIETITNTLVTGCKTTIIPNNIINIGNGAFGGCTNLVSIFLPNSVTSIGNDAFSGCTSLTSVSIPDNVTSIGNGTFSGCTSLTSISIPSSVTIIGGNAFGGTPWYEGKSDGIIYINKVLYSYKGDMPANTSIVVQKGTIHISENAFLFCEGLTSATIPNSVTSIGTSAFSGCTSLTSVIIGNGVTSIGSSAFMACGLTSITIPNSVTSIESGAFAYCTNLTSITIGNNEHLDISWNVFGGCESLESVTCYAETPPMITFYEDEDDDSLIAGAFYADELSEMKLYVPAKAIEQYKKAEEWKDFGQIIPIGATTIETDDDKPIVQPSLADVTITWKIMPNAATYTIAITRDVETICTLIFDADGVLSNIAYGAPARNGEQRHAPAAVMTEKGYRFTITGLERNTQYDYSISAKDKNGKELQTYSGTFKTQEEGSAVENTYVGNPNTQQKVFRNGQVLIQRGGKMYTVTGAEVK